MTLMILVLVLCVGLFVSFAAADGGEALSLPSIISDNMVLQQGCEVPVWGTAGPGDTVTVEFLAQK